MKINDSTKIKLLSLLCFYLLYSLLVLLFLGYVSPLRDKYSIKTTTP